jgi:hypothetical protein
MRQVMPHRNNIVADRGRCKSFLHPKTGHPPKSGYCGIPVHIGSDRFKTSSVCHNNDINGVAEIGGSAAITALG